VATVSVLEERFGLLSSGPVDSVEELEGELRRTKAQILALEAVVYGGSVDGRELWGESTSGVVESRVESPEALQLHRKQQHFAKLLGLALKFGLEERRVELAERESRLLHEAFANALRELGVDSVEGRLVLSRHLEALEVGVVEEPDPVRAELVAGVPEGMGFDRLEGVGVFGRGPDLALGLDKRPEELSRGGDSSKLGVWQREIPPDLEGAADAAEHIRRMDREWVELNDRRREMGLPPLKRRGAVARDDVKGRSVDGG
jgi:hypothetical protein